MSFAIAVLEENGFCHCSFGVKWVLPLQCWRKIGFAIAVLKENGFCHFSVGRKGVCHCSVG